MEKINSILDPRGQELLHTAVTLDLGKTKEILDKYRCQSTRFFVNFFATLF